MRTISETIWKSLYSFTFIFFGLLGIGIGFQWSWLMACWGIFALTDVLWGEAINQKFGLDMMPEGD